MDIGGDQEVLYLLMNPFLGYRAVRRSLDRQYIFRIQ
ncbi:MAG: putative PEP-binding protein [Psychrobacillus sp.]